MGSWKYRDLGPPFRRSSRVSPNTGRPRSSTSSVACPSISMPRMWLSGSDQSASAISWPSGLIQVTSFTPSGDEGRPVKKLRRRSTGFERKIWRHCRVKSSRPRFRPTRSQSTQLISLSWQ